LPSSIRPNKRELKSDRELLRTGNAIFLVVVLVRRPRERGDSSTRTRTKDEEECARAYLHDPLAGGGDVLARSRRSGGHQGPRSESLHWAAASFFRRTTSSGSFGGAASFTIPQVPGTVIVKVGDPIVSSEQIEGESWFVQSHEFALFSQRDGSIEMPEFPVHFGTRKGFTGPVTEVDEKVPGFSIQIERPPRTDPNRFLITTESLSIEEQWNPQPAGDIKTGTIFKRTITQAAENMTGMALAPAPTTTRDGIRVYPGNPQVTDATERGEFSGQRTETITYLVEKPGRYTLPAIRYDWWNPKTKELESKTLPGVTFSARSPPTAANKASVADRSALLWLVPILGLIMFVWLYRKPVAREFSRLHDRLDPPDHRQARSFLHACHRNDARASARALSQWKALRPDFTAAGELQEQIVELQRHLYGASASPESWKGSALATAFRKRSGASSAATPVAFLPPLNPKPTTP
jgi:hypothetical protein